MAADEVHEVSQNSPNFPNANWWIEWVGLHNDKLFICFRNGDCAEYLMPLADAQAHLAAILATNHPGAYVNFWLKKGFALYAKAACPAAAICAATPPTAVTAETAPTIAISTPITIYPPPPLQSAWLTAFPPGATFTATWTDPNTPAQTINFYNVPLDDGAPGRVLIGTTAISPFIGLTAGALRQIFAEYVNTDGVSMPITFEITP